MATVQTSKSQRRGKTSEDRVAPAASPLSMLFERQQDAVEAARSKGVQEIEVTFRIPGASFVAKVKVEDLERSSASQQPRRSRVFGEDTGRVPTERLRKAIADAKNVTEFYKTPEELFDALEKQD